MWYRWRLNGGVCWGTILFLAIAATALRFVIAERNYAGLIIAVPFLLGALAGAWMLWRDRNRRA